MASQRPSADQFVSACRREFGYLVDQYGFVAQPLVFSGNLEPFGVQFQGPRLAVVVRGIQYGSAIDVCLQTCDWRAEWGAQVDHLRPDLRWEDQRAAEATLIRSLDELRMRSELPADWLLDQRLPEWRSRKAGYGQLAAIHDYAIALRSCAGDLLSGDLSALPGLFASLAEHRRQQDILDRQKMADQMAKDIVLRAQRPRTVLEQVEIVQSAQDSIGYLRTEVRMLLKALGKNHDARSLSRFAESWRSLAERLGAEIFEFSYVRGLEAADKIVKALQNAQETVTLVHGALAAGQADQALLEKVAALDHSGEELTLALEDLSRRFREQL